MKIRRMARPTGSAALLAMALLCFAIEARSQEGPVEPRAEPAPVDSLAEEPANESLMSLILDSGLTGLLFMAVLGLFSLSAVTVAIERGVNTRRERLIPAEFVGELQRLNRVHEHRPELYRLLCSESDAPIATILSAGLLRAGRPVPEVEKAMEDTASREMANLRSSIRPLNVVASVAPLVGLLGTVVGMIFSFRTASVAGLGKGEMMAEGIYMALFTTAAGLAIAIPALLVAAWLSARVEKSFREIDRQLMATIPSFARMEQLPAAASLEASPSAHPLRS